MEFENAFDRWLLPRNYIDNEAYTKEESEKNHLILGRKRRLRIVDAIYRWHYLDSKALHVILGFDLENETEKTKSRRAIKSLLDHKLIKKISTSSLTAEYVFMLTTQGVDTLEETYIKLGYPFLNYSIDHSRVNFANNLRHHLATVAEVHRLNEDFITDREINHIVHQIRLAKGRVPKIPDAIVGDDQTWMLLEIELTPKTTVKELTKGLQFLDIFLSMFEKKAVLALYCSHSPTILRKVDSLVSNGWDKIVKNKSKQYIQIDETYNPTQIIKASKVSKVIKEIMMRGQGKII